MNSTFARRTAAVPLLADLYPEIRDELIARMEARPWEDGETLIRQGDSEPRDLVLLVDGEVDVYVRAGTQRLHLATLGMGSLFGEVAFFDETSTRSADVIGRGPGLAAVLHRREWMELSALNHPAARIIETTLLRLLADRCLAATARIEGVLSGTAATGLAGVVSGLLPRPEKA